MTQDHAWWQRGIVYQIYPRSFQDDSGDGIGDLPGITRRLDYLTWLGVDALWLSPVYPSPMADFGYDVTDYTGIDPLFGTMADFDTLLEQAHRRGLKVIMDFVPNHTSDQHPWFVESRASRENPKRDWYIWRDGKAGGPPTNWLSEFGGAAWTQDTVTGQYYYHAYLAAQPDLNWRNAHVRAAMYDVLRFWFEKGVDGFRLDTVEHLVEDEWLRDNPPHPGYTAGLPPTKALERRYSVDQPELQGIFADVRRIADAYQERVLIGESYLPLDRIVRYYGEDLTGLHLPFNFHLIGARWDAAALAALMTQYEALLPAGAWPNWVLGNHDRSRIASRVGPRQARVAAMLLLTLRGTPTLYYGDELGMGDVPIPPASVQDPWEKNMPGLGLGRDPVRTPMLWDNGLNGGFSIGEPWLPVGPLADGNVAAQRDRPESLLMLYRRLIALRRVEPALAVGDYGVIDSQGPALIYERHHGGRRLTICLNLGGAAAEVTLPTKSAAHILLSTDASRQNERLGRTLVLRPDEGVVMGVSD